MQVRASFSVVAAVGLMLLLVASKGAAQDRSPVQFTRDGQSTLIQKDVNGEAWTITYEVATGHVTGNVRAEDGSATFLDCDLSDLNDGVGTFACYAATGCLEEPCVSQPWASVGLIELERDFFLPAIDVPDPGDEPFVGCCSFPGGPCVDIDGSPQACVSTGGSPQSGSCVAVAPLNPCPDGVPQEMCFVGECQ